MNFLSKLQIFSSTAHWDEKRTFYVPEGTDLSLPGEKWYGLKNGKFQYPGRKKWLRDYRIRMKFVQSNKPFLYGRSFPENFSTDFLKSTHEENSELFFGCKGWSNLLTDDFIYNVCSRLSLDTFRQNVIELRLAGFSKDDFQFIYNKNLYDKRAKYLIDAKNHGLLEQRDLSDIIDWLDTLRITIKDATNLWRSSSAGIKITVSFQDKVMDYKSRVPKKNLHDFLSALISSCEQKVSSSSYTVFPPSNFIAPSGFSEVKSEKELMKISKANGWCAGQKSYRTGAVNGHWFFLFDSENRRLAQYDKNGKLMQARGQHNLPITDVIVSKTLIRSEQ